MARLFTPAEVTGPFYSVFADAAYAYGNDHDQGAVTGGQTIINQVTPLNDAQPSHYGRVYITGTGAVTGILMQAGLYLGQLLTVINYGAGSFAFATVATSLVLSGALPVLAAGQGLSYIWVQSANINSGNACWCVQ